MIMRERFGLLLSRSVPRFVIVCALGGASGACSTDALRFDDNPFKNPFSIRRRKRPARSARRR